MELPTFPAPVNLRGQNTRGVSRFYKPSSRFVCLVFLLAIAPFVGCSAAGSGEKDYAEKDAAADRLRELAQEVSGTVNPVIVLTNTHGVITPFRHFDEANPPQINESENLETQLPALIANRDGPNFTSLFGKHKDFGGQLRMVYDLAYAICESSVDVIILTPSLNGNVSTDFDQGIKRNNALRCNGGKGIVFLRAPYGDGITGYKNKYHVLNHLNSHAENAVAALKQTIGDRRPIFIGNFVDGSYVARQMRELNPQWRDAPLARYVHSLGLEKLLTPQQGGGFDSGRVQQFASEVVGTMGTNGESFADILHGEMQVPVTAGSSRFQRVGISDWVEIDSGITTRFLTESLVFLEGNVLLNQRGYDNVLQAVKREYDGHLRSHNASPLGTPSELFPHRSSYQPVVPLGGGASPDFFPVLPHPKISQAGEPYGREAARHVLKADAYESARREKRQALFGQDAELNGKLWVAMTWGRPAENKNMLGAVKAFVYALTSESLRQGTGCNGNLSPQNLRLVVLAGKGEGAEPDDTDVIQSGLIADAVREGNRDINAALGTEGTTYIVWKESTDRLPVEAADFFIFPSIREPFGLVPLEMMIRGLPVAMFKTPSVGASEYLLDNGLFDGEDIAVGAEVSSGNGSEGLGRAILWIVQNYEGKAAAMAKRAANYVIANLTWKNVVISIFEKMNSAPSATGATP